MKKYHASIECEDGISFYGIGDTPGEALKDFQDGPLQEHCDYYEINGGRVDVKVYEAIYHDDERYPHDDVEPHWLWVMGDVVETISIPAKWPH